MDYIANNPQLWDRQLESGAEMPRDDAFDDWLSGYLAEVLPAQQTEQEAPAQMPLLPDVPKKRFPWEEGAAPTPGHDIGSSTSGDTPHEQGHAQTQPSHEEDLEDSKSTSRAARIADKNRCCPRGHYSQTNLVTAASGICNPVMCERLMLHILCLKAHRCAQASTEAISREGKAEEGNPGDPGVALQQDAWQLEERKVV